MSAAVGDCGCTADALCGACRYELEVHYRAQDELMRERQTEQWERDRWQDAMADEGRW